MLALLLSLTLMTTPMPLPTAPVVPLWNGLAPQSHGTAPDDTPRLYVYLPEKPAKPGPAIIICPGGGYGMLAFEHEGSKLNLLGPNPDPALVENLSNETQVTPQTPPTLLVHAEDDKGVPIENSRLMLAALQKAGVPSALQEYPHGGHGFGFGPKQTTAPAGWLDRAVEWIQSQGWR